MTSTRELIDDAGEAWTQATSGPFLTACQDGSITKRAFDTWLFQARVWRGVWTPGEASNWGRS